MKNRIIKIIKLFIFTIILTSYSERFFVGTDLHYIIMPIGATTFIEAGVFEKTSLYNNEEVDFSADNLTWKAIYKESKDSDCVISLSCGNIISLKTSSSVFTLTAKLYGGTAADKNNFKFQLDVYDVVDLLYTNNKAMITPLKEGICTLTVSHPKSTFNRKVIIIVQ